MLVFVLILQLEIYNIHHELFVIFQIDHHYHHHQMKMIHYDEKYLELIEYNLNEK